MCVVYSYVYNCMTAATVLVVKLGQILEFIILSLFDASCSKTRQ